MKKLFKLIISTIFGFCLLFTVSCNVKTSFKLDFIVDNNVYATIETNGSELITMPKDPEKENFYFEGWYWDKDVWKNEFTARSLLDAPLSSNMEVYAHFVDDSYLFGTDIKIKDSSKIAIEGFGEAFYLVLRNNTAICRLEEYVQSNPKSTWQITSDLSGKNLIPSKTIQLVVGDNPFYYVQVTDKDGNHNTHILLIHRNNLFRVNFDSNGGTPCDSKIIEEGYRLENPPVSERLGYQFDGWDYDFSKPIKSNVVARAIWTANKYKITYNPNGGTVSSETQIVTYGQNYTLLTPTRLGYNFKGWSNGTGVYLPNSGLWTYTYNHTLFAEWEIINYSISYHLNGGSSEGIVLKTTYTVEDEIVLPSPSRTGYNFRGWATSQTGSGTVNYKINKGTTGNLSFFAKWEGKHYTITYDVNGGDLLDSETQTAIYGNEYVLASPTRFGYSFDGWFDGSTKVNNGIWQNDSDINLVAHWTILSYDIIYHLDGGTSPINYPKTYTVNDIGKDDLDNIITTNQPTKIGYSFDGLFDDSEFNEPYTPFSSQKWLGDKHIWVKWNANKYTVTFNVNGGDTLDQDTLFVYYDSEYTLPVPTRSGYEFVGWYYGSEKFEDGVWNRLDNFELVAKWSINTYTITYDLDGGINNIKNPNIYNYEDDTITLCDPSKVGYTFLGWTSSNVETPIKDYEIVHNSTGDLIVTANWDANTYHVTLDVNGGDSISEDSFDVIFDSYVNLAKPTKIGYTFLGWYQGETKYESGVWKTPDDVDLIAHWVAVEYPINYDLDGGINDEGNPLFYTYDSSDITLKNPAKTGYTFLGWTSLEVSVPTKNIVIPSHSLGSKSFLANWKVNEYIATLDVDGGDEIMQDSVKVVFDSTNSFPVPTRTGYTFDGWFYNDIRVDNSVWKIDHDVTVKAKWNPNMYLVVTYCDGLDYKQETTVYYDANYTLDYLVMSGYYFDGYYTEMFGEGTKYTDEYGHSLENYCLTDDLILYASYKYMVSFATNGGNDIEPIIKKQNETVSSLPTPTKPNRTFGGWYTDEKFENAVEISNIQSNQTLYAKWLEETPVSLLNYTSNYSSITIKNNQKLDIDELILPDHIGGKPVIEIEDSAFSGGLFTKAVIPNTVLIIGSSMLSNCNNLVELSIPFVGRVDNPSINNERSRFGFIFGYILWSGGGSFSSKYYCGGRVDDYHDVYYPVMNNLKTVYVTSQLVLPVMAFYNVPYLSDIYLLTECDTSKSLCIHNVATIHKTL